MAINLERVLNERKYGAENEKNSKTLVFRVGNENVNSGRDSIRKNPYIGKESNGGSAGASGNTQDGNVPSVKRTEPSDEVKNAVHKSLARISGMPVTGRDDVGIVPYNGNGGKSQGFTNLAPTRKNEFMLANMQKNYVSPEVKNAVDKAFERMGAVKAPSSPYSPYKTGSLDNQIEYAEQEYNARNEEYKDRLRMVRNRYTPEQGKAMLEKNKFINNQKDYRGAIDRADEKLENLKNIRYNIDIKNKRTEMEKVVNNEDFERYSADPGRKKEISFFRYIDPRYNAINQPIAYADEKERKIYFYYLEKEGQKKADEYYKTIERELTARRAVQKSKEDEKFGNGHKILASAETIAASIPALKDFNSEVRKYIKNKKNGTYEPMNPDSMNFDATRKQMDLEQGITKDMSGAGRFFTQTGLSMGKSLASSLFGKFGLAIMSGNAAAQSTFEALKNGATSRQALTKGLADGFTEYITEKVPFDNFFKIVKGGDIKGAKALLKNILKQAGAEGSGEALAEYMNYAIDRYVMGDKSDFNSLVNTYIENGYTANEAEKEAYKQYLIVNPALAFAGGAISGLGMGGVAQTTNYLAGKWQNHIEGKTAEKSKTDVATKQFSDSKPQSTLLYSLNDNSKNDSRVIIDKVYNNINKISSESLFDIKTDGKFKLFKNKSEYVLSIFNKQGNIAHNKEIGNVELVKSGAKSTIMHGYGETKLTAVKAIKNVIENGTIIDVSENYNGSKIDRYTIAGRGMIDGKNAIVGVVVKAYPTQNSNSKFYLHEAKIIEADLPVMTAPQLSVDTVNKSAPINNSVSYPGGNVNENKNAPSQQTENVQALSLNARNASVENGTADSISQNNGTINSIDIDGEGIGNNQTEAEKLAGARLERILKNRFGVETVHFNDENGSKGYYDPKTKKIYTNDFYTVNRYATTAHEFFHSYKDIDVEGYNTIKKAVLADLSLEEYNKYKDRQITLRNSNNLDTENIDIDDLVAEEVISDLGAEVLKNPESLEGIFKRFENDKTFIEKFMDYIRGLVRKVREFLNSDYIENDNDIRNLVKNYSEIENIYRSVLESGGTMDYSAEGNDTGVKYSITDANDTEKIGVKQQIKNNSETLGKMEPVYNSNLEVEKKGRMENQEWVMNLFKNYNYEVFREGLGKIIIDRRRIRSSLSYLKTDGDLAAYAALPAVLENGKIIGEHPDHKSRRYKTVTIGAPVVINGVRGNMAAVIRLDGENNYYKVHRILMPDGSSFVYENKISNAETAEWPQNNETTLSPADVAYDDIVSQNDEDVNINKIKSIGRATVPATAYGKQKGRRTNSNTSIDSVSHTSEDVNTNKIKKLGNVQVNSFNNNRLGTEYQTSDDSVSQSGEDVNIEMKRTPNFARGSMAAGNNSDIANRGSSFESVSQSDKDVKYKLPTAEEKQDAIEERKNANSEADTENDSASDYTYSALTEKADMPVAVINSQVPYNQNGKIDRKSIVETAIKNARKMNNAKNTADNTFVYVKDIGKDVLITKDGLRHGLSRNAGPTASVTLNIGEVLENSIKINELEPRNTSNGGYVLLGIAKDEQNNLYPVRAVVNNFAVNDVEVLDVLYAANAKRRTSPQTRQGDVNNLTPLIKGSSKISISDLLNIVKDNFPDVLSKDVLNNFDMTRPKSVLSESVKYALADNSEREAQKLMNEMSKEAKQATDEGLDIEKYYNTPREKRVTENAVRAPRLERMEKASEDFKKTGDSFKLPKKSDYNSYKRDAQRKGIYYNNIETYMKNQLSGARSDVEYDVIKKALDMFLQKKVAYENGEKARAQEVITSMDEAYKMLDTKRNFKLTKEIAEDITDKGKTVFSYKSKDFFRNMREVFGKHYGVVKDIIDDFNNSKGDMARSINERLADLYQTVVKDLGISKGSRESAAVMWYGEGEKAPDLANADDIALLKKMGIKDFKKLDPDIKVKYDGARLEQDFGHAKAEKIRKADTYFRKVYDEYIDALNAEIKEIYPFNPKKQIQKRKNYYRHFDELTNTYYSLFEMLGQNANIDPKLAGISPYTNPKSKWSSIEQKRKGKATVEDAVGGFLNYIPMAEYRLNIDRHISVIRTLASDLAELKGDNGNANNFIKFLNDYANDLAGKTVSNLDRVLIDCGGRKIVKGLSWVNNRVKTNKVLGNIASTAKQILNQTNGFLVLENPKNMLSGYADWFKGTFGNDADILKRYGESNFLTERFVDDSFSKFEKKSLQGICANLLGATDEMGVRIIWNAAYNEALDINKTGGEKINPARYADDAARNACGGRGIGEVPLIYKSQVAKLALPFQLEVQNNWKVIYDYFANRGISGERIKPEKDVKKKIAKAVSFLIASFGLNWLTETLTGSKGSMDIIGDIADGFGQGFKEKKSDETWKKILQGTKRSAQNISADALDNRLFGWVYASILESIDEDYADKLFNGNFQSNGVNIPAGQSAVKIAKKARQGDWVGAGAEAMTSFVTPYGGAQIDKTIRGLTDWGKGAKYQNDAYKKVSKFFANRNSNDYEGVDGKKKYDIEKNPLTFAQSALFGPSAFGGDYYNDQKTARYIEDEEKAQRAKREEKFRKNYKNESVIYLAKAQKDNDLIPYDEVKSDFKFTHKKQEYEFTIPKEAKEEYDKMLLDEMEKEYDKVMDKPEYIGALNARKAEILKDAKSKARKTVNAKIKKDYLDGKFGE